MPPLYSDRDTHNDPAILFGEKYRIPYPVHTLNLTWPINGEYGSWRSWKTLHINIPDQVSGLLLAAILSLVLKNSLLRLWYLVSDPRWSQYLVLSQLAVCTLHYAWDSPNFKCWQLRLTVLVCTLHGVQSTMSIQFTTDRVQKAGPRIIFFLSFSIISSATYSIFCLRSVPTHQ